MVTSLGQVYGVHSGVSGFPSDLNRKKDVCSFKLLSTATLPPNYDNT